MKRKKLKSIGKLKGATIGHFVSEETKRKIGLANMGKSHPHTEDTKRRISEKMKKHIMTYEHKKHLRENHVGMSGRKLSKEHRQKISERHKGDKSNWWKGGITPTYKIRRKAKLKENGGFHSIGEWEHLKALYQWTCRGCWRKEPEITLVKDHIIPVMKGGNDNIENIQPLCVSCNSRKQDKI